MYIVILEKKEEIHLKDGKIRILFCIDTLEVAVLKIIDRYFEKI